MAKKKQIEISREELIACLKYAEQCCAAVRLALENYDEMKKTYAIVWPPDEGSIPPLGNTC
jgi:hypothetical protein